MIGIFDSGFGGLTVFKEIKKVLPDYSYIYLGDNARAPYGGRSQQTIFNFTRQAADYLFNQGCQLVIIACNTASSEALRSLQQDWLPQTYPDRKLLGVIRPVVEVAAQSSASGRIGVIGTRATVESKAYQVELREQNPDLEIFQNACPLLVPLIEEGWIKKPETRMILKKYLRPLKQEQIDTLILGCTHYPLLFAEIKKIVGKQVRVLDAPKIVADKLADYLNRHPEVESRLAKQKTVRYLTTDSSEKFATLGSKFMGQPISGEQMELN
ncbi:MAG: glutamate racemase [Candidatus Komeilibacteria bacterium CG10_big_fil_rev_8_21_14_0_10_41_13]|uniref:Glutamate racemase n=1 Tax=Candidatus Komeilibacteria bacterium CG10_big_fil_rev_8_21_14_0_10_41_13 TaxID=1974476 RepID=A0A2M6WD22_9BACT|nr:MAG: glutamate racemase [Candidatus Komeilibacteria bacterium CG10_big_fil_rev_8_21_14_0_10_41_13]